MSHRLVIALTCDQRTDGVRCTAWFVGPSSTDIEGTRTAAAAQGWAFQPGTPYRHIGATDLCPQHGKQPP